MKTSVIRHRVADFLKQHAPFDLLPEDALLELAGTGRVTFHESDEYLLHRGQSWDALVRVIQQGRVEVLDQRPDGERLRDLLGEGDILGLGRFLGHESSRHGARTASDVILYSIDAGAFEAMVNRFPSMSRFLAAHGDAGSQEDRTLWLEAEAPPAGHLARRLRTCSPETPIRDAAARMTSGFVAVVDPARRPIGMMTDRELRQCAARDVPACAPCSQVMDARLETAPAGAATQDYLLQMMRSRSRHLLVTEDGTAASQLLAVLRESDLALACGRNPVLLLHEILSASDAPELDRLRGYRDALIAESLASPDTIEVCSALASALDAAILESVIRLAAEGLESPAVEACWMLFGRGGRAEILASETPVIGIVYADPPQDQAAAAAAYYSALAGAVQASHCRPLSAWKEYYAQLIRDPLGSEIYPVRFMFDFQPIFGAGGLAGELQQFIAGELEQAEIFIPILANDTLANLPPMTFFRGLVVELDGAERSTLDIGRYALQPVEDAARVFSLAKQKVAVTATLDRLQCAWGREAVLDEAAEAFRVAAFHCATAGFRNHGNSVIDPSRLTRYDQRQLKTAFQSIRRLIEFTSSAFVAATEL